MSEEKRVIKVAVGIIKDEGRFILAKRNDGGRFPGLWEFPGGSVGDGASAEESLKRHLAEKFNIDVVVSDRIGTINQDHEFGQVEVSAFSVECISKKIKLADHFAYRWVRISQFKDFDLVPMAQPLIEILKQQNN